MTAQIAGGWVLRLRYTCSHLVPQLKSGIFEPRITKVAGATGKSESDTGFTGKSHVAYILRQLKRLFPRKNSLS